MSRVLMEATPFEIGDIDSDFRHLYLAFVDDQGIETVITAAPDENGPIDFGNIEVSAGGLLEDSDVARGNDTPSSRGSREIDVGGREPADVWAIMLHRRRTSTTPASTTSCSATTATPWSARCCTRSASMRATICRTRSSATRCPA